MNNQEIKDIQRLQNLEQSQLVGYWAKTKGITQKDLLQHPCIDDLILLIQIKDNLFYQFNNSEKAKIGAYLGNVYTHKKGLSKGKWNKIENIIKTANERHLKQLVKTAKTRQKIKALRTEPYCSQAEQKSADDMMAKTADAFQSPPWD